MNKKIVRWVAVGAAVAGMGAGMPSCPGQQAMQEELDALQKTTIDVTKKLQTVDSKVTGAISDMTKEKDILTAMKTMLDQDKARIDALEKQLQDLVSKKGGAKKKR